MWLKSALATFGCNRQQNDAPRAISHENLSPFFFVVSPFKAVYIVAFAMELWLITEATGRGNKNTTFVASSSAFPRHEILIVFFYLHLLEQLPSPPYILCVVYFITWIMSVALLVGLALVIKLSWSMFKFHV